ncbi:MAG: tripartite tricarboxylate transporter substrate-binding protein [Defluviicoccus sp.]|nr:tripartite tricarboxylate transporter substrate-binding protein [Defluviicoccus sp.]MDE0382507.1 tripartite tricarboxylate transporter substrate-binding protein [Defluviicoccus sp.]
MSLKSFGAAVATTGALALAAVPAGAAWKPSGPINLMIAFAAGGGADTQARLIATELEKTRGWKIIPQNVTGKGGAVMARKLKTQPNDGLTFGIAVTETFGYNMLAVKKAGYAADDFTFVTTTAGSQMGIVAKTDRGWKTIQDVIAAAKGGATVKLGAMSAKLADIAYAIQQKYGVKFNTVVLRGGRKVLNAITAGDVDVGWVAGIQAKGVRAGDLVNLMSGELSRLKISPDAPTLGELGIPYDAGAKFLIVAPKGIPDDARKGFADAVAAVLTDKSTKAAQFVQRAFGGPQLISGAALEKLIDDGIAGSRKLMAATQ